MSNRDRLGIPLIESRVIEHEARVRSNRQALATSGKTMDVIILQLLNGLDKGGAYALIALGLTLQIRMNEASRVLVALAASTLTTPLGWALAHLYASAPQSGIPSLFAVTTGFLIYVGARLVFDGFQNRKRPAT